MKDLKNNVDVIRGIAPAAYTDGTENGAAVDLKGFNGAMAVFDPGVVTDGTHTPKLQDSPDGTTWTDVGAADQEGTLAVLASNVIQRVGYKGNRRYLRQVVTTTGATTGAVFGASIVRGMPEVAPV